MFALVLLIAVAQEPAQEPVPTFGTTVVINSGLKGLVYHIRHNSKHLPNFEKLKPKGTIYTTSLNIPPRDFQSGFPGVTTRFEWFAIDYTGKFWIEKPAMYRFSLSSDDGSRLYVDDQLIIDNDGIHSTEERFGSLELTGGVHSIRVSYFQGPRFTVALILMIAGPGENFRIFNTDDFTPPPDSQTGDLPEKDHPRQLVAR